MNRRNAIGNIVILSVGAIVMPSCDQKEEGVVKFKNFSLRDGEQNMIASLSDMIIPKTSFIGATDLNAHEFTLMMVDDCYDPDGRKKYLAGLKEFDKYPRNKYGSSFVSCTAPQRTEWLTMIERNKDIPEDVAFFYETTKRHTVQAFTSSKEYMTGIIKYNMVPGGNFKGCVPVTKA